MSDKKTPLDFSVESNRALTGRIGVAWRDIRRGAANNKIRQLIFEDDKYAIDPGQFDVLLVLVGHESLRMGEVADLMGVDPSTATRSVQRLIKDGLAERIEHDGDARVVMVGPTDFGREIYLHVVDRRRDVLKAVIEQFPDDERELVADVLERFSAAVDRAVNSQVSQHQ